jgi:hypothetical protein
VGTRPLGRRDCECPDVGENVAAAVRFKSK